MTAALELRTDYADPGYQPDKKPRYKVDSEDHVRAAWSYINQADNAKFYTADQLKQIKSRIKAAGERFGITFSDDGGRSAFMELIGLRMYEDSLHPHAPAGSSTGGQFVPSKGGSGKTPPKKAPAHAPAKSGGEKATAHPRGTFAYDPQRKTGPGYGSRNGDPTVHKLQADLVRLGLAAQGDEALADGKYGPKTTAAVKRAQQSLGMKADGVATPELIAKLAATKALPKPKTAAKPRRSLDLCVRSFGFELEVRGDGRTLEGYAAVFNSPTRIRDIGGDFDEVIHHGAFSRSIQARTPILQWDHGKDPRVGTVPIGSIRHLEEDTRGLHVTARLFDNPVVEPVRQAIAEGAVTGMSFRFGVPDGGDEWPTRDRREIRDADVHELGPVAFPAYDTTSVSVRDLLAQLDPSEIRSLVRELAEHLDADPVDLAGRSRAWSADGGDTGDEPAPAPPLTNRQRLDDGALRTRGILR